MSDILIRDLLIALYADARNEPDSDRRAQLEADAKTMEEVWLRSKYSLAPTRDQMMAALGNTSLNLAGRLDDLIETTRRIKSDTESTMLAIKGIEATVLAVTARQGKLEKETAEMVQDLHDLGVYIEDVVQNSTDVKARSDKTTEALNRVRDLVRQQNERIAQVEADQMRFQKAVLEAIEGLNLRTIGGGLGKEERMLSIERMQFLMNNWGRVLELLALPGEEHGTARTGGATPREGHRIADDGGKTGTGPHEVNRSGDRPDQGDPRV